MKTAIVSLLVFVSTTGLASEPPVMDSVRSHFMDATLQPDLALNLFDQIHPYSQTSPLLMAYLGASNAIMIKTTWNPFTKWEWLENATLTLNQAVELDPENVEIRFLRYAVEWHVPEYLGLSEHKAQDRRMIEGNLPVFMASNQDDETKAYIAEFMSREQ